MVIPVAVGEFDEAHAGLGEAPRQQALAAEAIAGAVTDAVEFEGLLRFATEIHEFGQGVLHAECEFERLDRALDTGLVDIVLELRTVELLDEVELDPLQLPV